MRVLNNGSIELIEHMGGDHSVIRNSRRCWRSEDKSNEKSDANLIRHLLKKKHMTPFESMVFTFDVKCPLFIARQWRTHRVGSYNEESLRYCVAENDFWIPESLEIHSPGYNLWLSHNYRQFADYENWVKIGCLPKEQARAILPVGIYTKFYWTVNGSSLMNFLRLRTDSHAQEEMQVYANAIYDLVEPIAPVTFSTFKELML